MLLVAAFSLCACDKENEVLFMNENGFGTRVSSGHITTDGNLKYNITQNESNTELIAGKRVIYVCDLLKMVSDNEYNVKLKQISYPLTKKPVSVENATGDEFKEDNPISVSLAWFASGYLNLRIIPYATLYRNLAALKNYIKREFI